MSSGSPLISISRFYLIRGVITRDYSVAHTKSEKSQNSSEKNLSNNPYNSGASLPNRMPPFFVERDPVSKTDKSLLAKHGLEVRDNKLYESSDRSFYLSFRLTLVRHAESELNVQKKTQGRYCLIGHGREPELLRTSFNEIQRVSEQEAERLYRFTHHYSSPQLRALQTADGLFGRTEIRIEEALSEVHMGQIEGVRRDKQDPRSLKLYDVEGDVTHRIGMNGQSALSKLVTSALFLEELEARHGGKKHDVVGVTHSNSLSLYLALLGQCRKLPHANNFALRNRQTKNLGFMSFGSNSHIMKY